jgi:hypothetical protein
VPGIGLLGLGAVLVLLAIRAPFRLATTTLLISLVVLPEALPLPVGPEYMATSRVVLWAYSGALLVRLARGELRVSVLRVTRVHVAFAAFLAVAFLNGCVLAAQPNPRFEAVLGWLTLADQLLVFVAGVTAVRVLGPWWMAKRISILAAVLAVLALGERYLDLNWNHFFFEHSGSGLFAGSKQMDLRGGAIRVRGPSLFALEFGWICAFLVPLTLVVATRVRGLLPRLLPGALSLAVVWTVSRSALVGIALGVVVTVAGARDRRVLSLALLGASVAAVIALQSDFLGRPYEDASPDSADSRVRRIVAITEEVEERPLVGLGIAGPRARAIEGTDTSYVLLYAQLGVVGLAAFGVLLATTLLTVAGGLRGPPSDDRALAAAALAVLVVALLGTASFDNFSIAGSTRIVWLVAAIGVGLHERAAPARRGPRRASVPARVGLVASAVAAGAALAAAAPTHVVWAAQFDTVPLGFTAKAAQDPAFIGRVLINTTCEVIGALPDLGAKLECREPREAPTVGEVRVQGRDGRSTAVAVDRILEQMDAWLPQNRVFVTSALVEGRPTWATTAPVWLGLTGLATALLLPPLDPAGGRPAGARPLRRPRRP